MSCFEFVSRMLASSLLILAGAYAGPAFSQDIGQAPGNGMWSSQAALRCGKHRISLTTSCHEQQEDDTPLCPSQEMHVEGTGANKVTEYRHQINGGDQDYVTEAACFEKGEAAYLVLSGTNFGNCAGCEWEDFYTPDGRYLGSTAGIYKDSGFRRKTLSPGARKAIKETVIEKYRTAQTGPIPRAKQVRQAQQRLSPWRR
jgi:hypothetical protein